MIPNINNALSAYRQSGGVAPAGIGGGTGDAGSSGNFVDTLKGFMNDAMTKLEDGEKAAASSATGKGDLAGIVIAIGDAEQMLQTVVTIRDKVISAYQDISKTSI